MTQTVWTNEAAMDFHENPQWQVILRDARGVLVIQPRVFAALDVGSIDSHIAWRQDSIRMYGRQIPLPRLTAWYGDPGADYVYSGILNQARPWPRFLQEIRDQIADKTGVMFNAVLCNRYADGAQHQGYHADDEPELGDSPTIASVSLGSTRRFLVKSADGADRISIDLEHGSLLMMLPPLQRHFIHALPKTKKPVGLRINLTFRLIKKDPGSCDW